jgi:hypothetical protein
MSETDTQHRETRAERRAREQAEQEGQQGTPEQGNAEQGTPEPTAPNLEYLATLDPTGDLSDEDRAAFDALTEKQAAEVMELRAIAAVEGFAVTDTGTSDLQTATAPVRNRKPVQKAMDKVAAKAYADWVEAGRPTTWQRMPVITYFIDPGTEDGQGSVADYRKWIRAAVQIVPAEPYEKDGKTIEPSGVRARFGGDFVLTEKMAAKIGKPEQAGKTVLAWAAIDKRNVHDRNGSDGE